MRRALRLLAAVVIGFGFAFGVLAVGLYIATDGEHAVSATVADDAALPRVTIGDYTFHAQTFGSPGDPAVIVLHGGPGGDYRSLLMLQELARDGYLVVFFDQRGSGLSERVPAESLSFRVMIEDLDAFVDRFGGGRPVHLIGHSWGAMLVSAYLGQEPAKVGKAVLAEPGFLNAEESDVWEARYDEIMSGPEYWWLALRAGFEAQHVDGPDPYAAEDFLVGARILPYFENHPQNSYHCPGEPYGAPAWRWGATASNAILRTATDGDLDSLSAHAATYGKPVLFLAGACNTWIGPDLQAKHAAMYPAAGLTIIAGAGHDMFWDNPEATLAAIRAFLGR